MPAYQDSLNSIEENHNLERDFMPKHVDYKPEYVMGWRALGILFGAASGMGVVLLLERSYGELGAFLGFVAFLALTWVGGLVDIAVPVARDTAVNDGSLSDFIHRFKIETSNWEMGD